MRAAHTLNSGILETGSRAGTGQQIGPPRAPVVEGQKKGVLADGIALIGRGPRRYAPPRRDLHHHRHPCQARNAGLKEDVSRRNNREPDRAARRDAPRLRSALVLRHHAPGRQVKRVFVVGFLGCRPVHHGMKIGPVRHAWRSLSRNRRGVPGCDSSGHGQNTPFSC